VGIAVSGVGGDSVSWGGFFATFGHFPKNEVTDFGRRGSPSRLVTNSRASYSSAIFRAQQ
jgi:hypothetical protein